MSDNLTDKLKEWIKENAPDIYEREAALQSFLLTFQVLLEVAPQLEVHMKNKYQEPRIECLFDVQDATKKDLEVISEELGYTSGEIIDMLVFAYLPQLDEKLRKERYGRGI